MSTVSEIIEAAQKLIGEVAGIGVQTYGESITLDHVKRGFNMMHTKYHWSEYIEWMQLTLDGTTGRLTIPSNNFQFVREFGDFITIQPTGTRYEVPMLAKRENPFTFTNSTYPTRYKSIPVSDADFATKRLQFYPVTCTGTLDIQVRVYPVAFGSEIDSDTEIHLDHDLMTYTAAFQHLAFDDTNQNALNVIQNMMETRYNDLIANRADKPLQVSGGAGIPSTWQECR